ncbi:MAG: hypothetical protein EXQ57_06115, partial [Bryobacterales bacterium]|nr:hypothetical protein [Bryobacterales bacterium]
EQVYRFGSGATDVIQLFRMLQSAFPDLRAEIIEQFVSGDFVATRKTFHGTHLGEFPGVPPAGKKASFRVVDFVRVTDGKMRGHWHTVAPAALFSQLQSSALHHAPQRI